MTLLEIAFRYTRPPGENTMRALREMRDVYGIWGVSVDEPNHILRVEYDASRLRERDVEFLLRNAGIDVQQTLSSPSATAT